MRLLGSSCAARAGFRRVLGRGATTGRAQDPQSLVKAMQANGYTAQLTADKTGDR